MRCAMPMGGQGNEADSVRQKHIEVSAIPPMALCRAMIRMRRLMCMNSSIIVIELSITTTRQPNHHLPYGC